MHEAELCVYMCVWDLCECVYVCARAYVCMVNVYSTEPLYVEQSEYNKFVHIICTMNLEQFIGSTLMTQFVDWFIPLKTRFNFNHQKLQKLTGW